MHKIILFVVLGIFTICTAYADDTAGVAPASPRRHIKHKKGIDPAEIEKQIQYDVTIKTKYGIVQYNNYGSIIAVNGELVYDNSDIGAMKKIGDFKLSNEEVLLFEGSNLGNPGITGIMGETFFLILKPNHSPAIVQAKINPAENPVNEAWKKNDEIYVDYREDNEDLAKPPLKFVSDKVIFSNGTSLRYDK